MATCMECGNYVSVSIDIDSSCENMVVEVDPCDSCLNAKYDEGHKDGEQSKEDEMIGDIETVVQRKIKELTS